MFSLFKLLFVLAFSTLAAFGPNPSQSKEAPQEVVVHNRILAKVNGKNISVLDVMKKMDVFLNRYYPDLAKSPMACLQFYQSNWRDTLEQMLSNELMMADAESREIKVSDGEVREEVIHRFGPNIMGTLDKIGITYDEAKKIVQEDLVVQRINWLRVSSKALQRVTLQDVKAEYERYCQENPAKEMWSYQVFSIRSPDKELAKAKAILAYSLLTEEKKDLSSLPELLTEPVSSDPEEKKVSLQLSPLWETEQKELSLSHKEVLSSLTPNSFSSPIEQKSGDGSSVFRIFYLKAHTKTNPPSFSELSAQLKENLLQKAAGEEMASYAAKLRSRFGDPQTSVVIPPDFEPFSVRTY